MTISLPSSHLAAWKDNVYGLLLSRFIEYLNPLSAHVCVYSYIVRLLHIYTRWYMANYSAYMYTFRSRDSPRSFSFE